MARLTEYRDKKGDECYGRLPLTSSVNGFSDQLTEVLRRGARSLLAQAVEAEVSDFLGAELSPKVGDGLIF